MELTVLYVDGCPHRDLAFERVNQALARLGLGATIAERVVGSEEEAAGLGFGGSPTIFVDGRDPFPSGPPALACRLYSTETGPEGAPSVDQLVDVLRTR